MKKYIFNKIKHTRINAEAGSTILSVIAEIRGIAG